MRRKGIIQPFTYLAIRLGGIRRGYHWRWLYRNERYGAFMHDRAQGKHRYFYADGHHRVRIKGRRDHPRRGEGSINRYRICHDDFIEHEEIVP